MSGSLCSPFLKCLDCSLGIGDVACRLPRVVESTVALPLYQILQAAPSTPLCQHSFHLILLLLLSCLTVHQLDGLWNAGRTCETLQLARVEDRMYLPLLWECQLPRLSGDLSYHLKRPCPTLSQLPGPFPQR